MLNKLRDILGDAYVLTGADTAKWAMDWTGRYPSNPIAVLRPADTAQVSAIMRLAYATNTPVVPVSGYTGLTGGAVANDALLLSLDRMNAIRDIASSGRTATVEAGVILANLHSATDDQDMIFPLTFGAKGSAMIGGVLATNAGGSNVVRYGNTRDLVLGIEAVMANGDIMNLMGALHKDNSGLNLRHLLIGSEGTLGIITAAVVKLFPKPRAYATAMVAVPTLDDALALLHKVQDATSGAVEAFEYMPRSFIDRHLMVVPNAKPPFDTAYDVNILIELGTTSPQDSTPGDDGAIPLMSKFEELLGECFEAGQVIDAVVAQNEQQRAEMWDRRESAAEITFHVRPFVDTDVAVALPDVPRFLDLAQARLAKLDPGATDVTVAHLGDGNLHYTTFPTRDDPALIDAMREMVEDVVQELNGSFSAEHGIGLSKLSSMRRRKDPVAMATMRAIKSALDPKGILNPGKLIPPAS